VAIAQRRQQLSRTSPALLGWLAPGRAGRPTIRSAEATTAAAVAKNTAPVFVATSKARPARTGEDADAFDRCGHDVRALSSSGVSASVGVYAASADGTAYRHAHQTRQTYTRARSRPVNGSAAAPISTRGRRPTRHDDAAVVAVAEHAAK